MIKATDGNLMYFKHSSGAKSTTNKGKTSALNEWENRSADEIIPQNKLKSFNHTRVKD